MRFISIAILLLLSFTLLSQKKDFKEIDIWNYQKLKFDVLAPFFTLSEFRVAYEFPIRDQTTCQIELSGISNYFIPYEMMFRGYKNGFRIKIDYRMFFNENFYKTEGAYWGPELFFKYERFTDEQWVYRFNQSYQQLLVYHTDKFVLGTNIKIGNQFKISTSGNIIDLYMGGGFRIKKFNDHIPDDAELVWTNTIGLNELFITGDYILLPHLTMGVQFGFSPNFVNSNPPETKSSNVKTKDKKTTDKSKRVKVKKERIKKTKTMKDF